MALRMAARAAHVAFGNLGMDRRPRGAWAAEIEALDRAGAVVEVEPPLRRAAVDAAVLALIGVQPIAALLHIASDIAPVALPVVAVTLSLTLLVALPRFRRVVRFATSHASSLVDYWGDQSLGTAEMPEAAA